MYEVYGMKLGDRDVESSHSMYGVDPGKRIMISYYMWCLKGPGGAILVDTGMTDRDIEKRALTNVKKPRELLGALGIDPAGIKTLIVSHLHADHFSAYDLYPNATFYLQRKELAFFATADVRNKAIAAHGDIPEAVRLNYAGRVRFLDGDAEVAPGVHVHLAGGHTPGLQMVTIDTASGTVLLCCDAIHLYRNIEDNVHSSSLDVVQTYATYDRIRKLAPSKDRFIPGHDPATMKMFPLVADGIVKIG